MNDWLLLIIAAIVALLACWEWPKFSSGQKREKAAFLALLALGAGLTVWLIFFPDTPGPNHWIDTLFQPLGTLLEN